MAKIAIELQQALARRAEQGGPGRVASRRLAEGEGWGVSDAICTSGPQDRPFEEQHGQMNIAIVIAGSFQYRSTGGRELMTPGSLFLGNHGHGFECRHDHGTGDRCISFGYTREYFERVAADAGVWRCEFSVPRLPPLRALAPVVARACAGLAGCEAPAPEGALAKRAVSPSLKRWPDTKRSAGNVRTNDSAMTWEEISLRLAVRTLQLAEGIAPAVSEPPPSALARVTRVVRRIERHPEAGASLASLAREAGLSPYHFLRTFERVTGVTPHQYILRARLRTVAVRLAVEPDRVLDVALDCGFGDVSNFNRMFRAEFGVSPREYRARLVSGQKAFSPQRHRVTENPVGPFSGSL